MQNPEPRTEHPQVAASVAGLDDRATVERLDPQGLLARIEALPEQCEEAWRRASTVDLPAGYEDARDVVVLGMGGSAIAGDILRSLATLSGRKPTSVARGYDLPSFVGEETLVIACSHSGNTEETLSAFQQATATGARIIVVTTGGRIQELAEQQNALTIVYQYDGEPRSALGCQLMLLLAIGERAGLLEPQETSVAEAIALMREQRGRIGFTTPGESNAAKQLAGRLYGRLPVFIGAGVLATAAYRWKTQLNENSKSWALTEELPELNHNSIAGFGLPKEAVAQLHVVFLHHPALHPRLLLRYEATAEALANAGVSNEQVEVGGSSALAQMLSATYTGDLMSYYLALLNEVEPSPVAALDDMKRKLAGS